MSTKNLYAVETIKTVYVVADSHDAAEIIAKSAVSDAEDAISKLVINRVTADWEHVVPYGSEDNKTCQEFLESLFKEGVNEDL